MYEPLEIHLDTPVEEVNNLAAKFNQQVAALDECEAQRQQLATDAMERLAELSADDLRDFRSKKEGDVYDLARRAVELTDRRAQTLTEIVERLEASAAEKQTALTKVREQVGRALKKQGFYPSTPNLAPQAAEIQFTHLVNGSDKVIAARRAHDQARDQLALARQQLAQCDALRERALIDQRSAARQLLGLAAPREKPTGPKPSTPLIA